MKPDRYYHEPNGLKHRAVDTSMETTDNSADGIRHWLRQLLAIFLLAGNLGLAEEMPFAPSQPDAQPPFDIAPGLFDAAQPRTLGLSTVPGIHTIVYRAAGEYIGAARVTHRMRFLYSDDTSGTSAWHPANIEPPELHRFGYTEPSFYLRADGVLVATLRSQQGFLHACTSEDRGQTWAAARQTNFPDSTARTAAGNLPCGGVYLINNPLTTPFDRSLLTIALSRDGRLFHRAFLVRGEPTKQRFDGKYKPDGWQFPHACVWKDALFIAYSKRVRLRLSDV